MEGGEEEENETERERERERERKREITVEEKGFPGLDPPCGSAMGLRS
jgi:hypothetical protein